MNQGHDSAKAHVEALRDIRGELEKLLDWIDLVGADVAGLHVDAAVVELFRLTGDDPGDRAVPWPETVPRH
jgi:hypothetical protein